MPVLPRIANFDDLDPLRAEPAVELVLVRPGRPLPRDADLVILPGSKATIGDLEFLRAEGWDIDLLAHRRHGGRILGLCGGYQMLGRTIADPLGIEGRRTTASGLGLLEIDTVLGAKKRLRSIAGRDLASGTAVAGYEMHLGDHDRAGAGAADAAPRRPRRRCGQRRWRGRRLLSARPLRQRPVPPRLSGAASASRPAILPMKQRIETTLDRLADHLERHLDLAALLAAARPPRFSETG